MARRKPTDEAGEKELTDLKWQEALMIGFWQCLAFWPGFSRSLATILGCRMMKLKMSAAVEFSFLLGLITLTAATAKEGLSHGSKIVELYGVTSPLLALFVAFVSAIVSVKFMIKILSSYGLTPFGYYRLLLAGLCLMLWK
jgi:undecaprenyl-diphosphatase